MIIFQNERTKISQTEAEGKGGSRDKLIKVTPFWF